MSATNGHTPVIPGVEPAVAQERGYRRIESERQLDAYTNHLIEIQRRPPGLLVPIYRCGDPIPYTHLLRPDRPRLDHRGKDIKYEWGKGVPLCLDVLPHARAALADPTVEIWITEGAKKADALTSTFAAAIVAININGVWGWRRREKSTGASLPLDDFDQISWEGRRVILAFDSDVVIKSEVQDALRALGRYLKGRGAVVHVLLLPDDGDKVGVDDAIATGMTGDDLRLLVRDLDELPGMSLDEILTTTNLTDAGNAECMAAMFGDMFRYDHTRGKFLYWDGTRWQMDADGEAQRAALQVARARQAAAVGIEDVDRKKKVFSWGITSESNTKRISMLQTAAILEPFKSTVDLYDRDPMLATVLDGTIDFRSGAVRPSRREDYLTMQLGTHYDPAATCPRWELFISEICGGDQELAAYLRRAIAYSLTGLTNEQVLFLLYGLGANGKSVFLEILTLLLGEYAANTSFDTFDAGRRSEATNDLAALKGKRIVTVIETEDDRRLAEARVKAVTGQDAISCRFLYGEYFTYRPQFKIWMAMNHKPMIRGTERGIWRRVKLIPFTQNFDGREDHQLVQKLRAELPGILNWALEGLQDWRDHGLGTAAAIEQATEEYRLESDLVGQWLEECTVRERDGLMLAKAAIASYREWCKDRGYREPNERALGRRMSELGFERSMTGQKRERCYLGVSLETGDHYDHYEHNLRETSLSENDSRKVPPKRQNNDHNDHPEMNLPRQADRTYINGLLLRCDKDSLKKARDFMAGNAGYDWREQIDKAERVAAKLAEDVT